MLSGVAPPLCWGCRGPAPRREPLCAACRATLHRLGSAPVTLAGVETWAPLAYEGAARELVRALKYRRAERLALPMASQIAANAPAAFLDRDTVLVPVPLHRSRLRRRGFNQAALIARALAARTGLEPADVLERGLDASQVGRARGERLALRAGEIALRAGASPPEQALLVDDVITTGATLTACARALLHSGARNVRAIAFARTLAR